MGQASQLASYVLSGLQPQPKPALPFKTVIAQWMVTATGGMTYKNVPVLQGTEKVGPRVYYATRITGAPVPIW